MIRRRPGLARWRRENGISNITVRLMNECKKEYGYCFYPEAYAELQALCNDYFPSDPAFYEKAKDMNKTLFHLNGTEFFPKVSSLIISSAVRSLRNRMREISCRRVYDRFYPRYRNYCRT